MERWVMSYVATRVLREESVGSGQEVHELELMGGERKRLKPLW